MMERDNKSNERELCGFVRCLMNEIDNDVSTAVIVLPLLLVMVTI